MSLKKLTAIAILLFSSSLFTACTPEVGSRAWCDALDKKDKGEWSVNEIGDYAKHCVFKSSKDAP